MELELADWTPENAAARVPILNDPAVYRFLSPDLPLPYTEQDSQEFLEICKQEQLFELAIVADGVVVGSIGGSLQGQGDVFEMGYYLATTHHRQGIMSRAIALFLARLHAAAPQVNCVQARVFDFNDASQALLVHCGFSRVPSTEMLQARDGLEHRLALFQKGF